MKVRGNISKLAKWIGQTLVVLIISAIVGLLMLLAVYKLGTGMIYSHVLESALALEKEGNSYDIGGIEAYITDSFDDAIFLNQAMVKGEHGLLSAALSGYTYSPEGAESPAEALTECLKKDVNLSEYSLGAPLVRFWCGYLVPLKILLKFLTLSQLRMLNLYLQPLIILIMMLLMVKRDWGAMLSRFFFLISF